MGSLVSRRRSVVWAIVALLGAPLAAEAQVRVPSFLFPTVQSAIDAVGSGLPQGAVIDLSSGVYLDQIVVTGDRSFTLRGAGADATVLSGGGRPAILALSAAGPVRVEGLTVTGGGGSLGGGIAMENVSASVVFSNCTITGNVASGSGGGVALINVETAIFDNCQITNNASGLDGGGIYAFGSTVFVSGGQISGNTSVRFGAGAFINASTASFSYTRISANVAGGTGSQFNPVGGGVAFIDGSGTFDSVVISGNQSKFAGGGLYALGSLNQPTSSLVVRDSEIDHNVTLPVFGNPGVGGGIYVEDNVVATVSRSRIHTNTATQGGGLSTFRGTFSVDHSVIEANHATAGGGGIGAGADGQCVAGAPVPVITLTDSVVRNNASDTFGGGIAIAGQGTGVCPLSQALPGVLTLTRTLVAGNTAVSSGAGIQANRGNVSVTDSQIMQNAITGAGTGRFGGGLAMNETAASLVSTNPAGTAATTIANNVGPSGGGGLFSGPAGSLNINGARIYNNTGGGLFLTSVSPTAAPTGTVTGSVIADNSGFQIVDGPLLASCPTPSLSFTSNEVSGAGGLYQGCGQNITTIGAFNGLAGASGNTAPPPTFATFVARPGGAPPPKTLAAATSVLAWSVAGAGSVTIAPTLGVQAGPTGSADVSPSCPTTYTLTSSVHAPVMASLSLPIDPGAPIDEFFPYDPGFRGGVFVAAGDVNGDGRADIITGVGVGGGPHVRVWDGLSAAGGANPPTEIFPGGFFPYDPGFRGGVFVAAGDVNGDGRADIITGVGVGGGPHVRVFDGTNPTSEITGFFPYDPGFRGGVFVAAGTFNPDPRADIVTGVGVGGGPHVRIFSGATNPPIELFGLFPYPSGLVSGIRVAVGDVNGDGTPDLVVSPGPGGGPHIRIIDGATLGSPSPTVIREFFAFGTGFLGGVFIAAGDVDGDGKADVIVGTGPGGTPQIRVFSGADGSLLADFLPYAAGFRGGVMVAAGRVTGSGRAQIITGVGPGGGPDVKVFDLPVCP